MGAALLTYRWIVFLLAAGYVVRLILFSDYNSGVGPFRYLTFWALILSFFCASRMIAIMENRSERRWGGAVAATSVINAMVVILYWRLYFDDPTSVTANGIRAAWHLDLYLHGLGPALQVIDALFLHRSFRTIRYGLIWLLGIVGGYVLWAELIVQRLHDRPSGEVTSGLPYPFLNDLDLGDRIVFYASNLGAALLLFFVFTGLALVIRRLLGRGQAARVTHHDSSGREA
ncbi:hypothetical protein AADZ90_002510 [Aestuariibius sp. 2305UL40-4]|uniref:hypothetical protein n=1 Tax=Aestuariibius violaceus TaxID=3234132 RepID=UPI00345EC757